MKISSSAIAGLVATAISSAAAQQNITLKINGVDYPIDVATETMSSDSSQDHGSRPLVVSSDGRSVTLEGNIHRSVRLPAPLVVTGSTQLDFDFTLADKTEVHAFCLVEENGHPSGSRCFMAANAQSINWKKLSPQTAVGETRHYKVPVGSYFGGYMFNYLILMQDNDSSNKDSGSCTFANIEIAENPALIVKVNGTDTPLDSAGWVEYQGVSSGQDTQINPLAVSPDGRSVRLQGNIHRAIPFPDPLVITKNTNLDFDFTLTERTEVHSICLTETWSTDAITNCLVVANDQVWGDYNLDPKTAEGDTRHYTVPFGLLVPTAPSSEGVKYLALMQDNDSSQRWFGDSAFANIELSEVERPKLMIKVNDADVAIDTATAVAFDPSQDTPMHYLELSPDDDTSVHLSGNVHRAVEFPTPLVVNEATELDFDFTLNGLEEAHSICVTNTLLNSRADDDCFLVGGTQSLSGWNKVGDMNPPVGVERHYTARVGLELTPGEYKYLVFMQDNDKSDRTTGSSTFSNIAFSQRPSLNVNVKGTVTPLLNYQRSYNNANLVQDTKDNLMVVSDDGSSAIMYGNLHKALAFPSPVTVDDDTILGLRVKVDEELEVTGLCLDDDLIQKGGLKCFKFSGTQDAFIYRGVEQTGEGEEKSYLLRMREFDVGTVNYIGFVHDNDSSDRTTGISTIGDLKIYQAQPSCLKDHSFGFSFSECTVANFVAEVQTIVADPAYGCPEGTDAHEELLAFFDASTSHEVSEKIEAICSSAYVPISLPFNRMLEKEDQFVGEFFDGGGKWNYEFDEAGGPDLSEDAARVQVVSDSFGSNRAVSWPDVHNFHKCELRAAMCCYVANRAAASVDYEPADASDACYMDFSRARESSHVRDGYSVYYDGPAGNAGGVEGPLLCHGFAWGDDAGYADAALRGNTLFQVAMKQGLLDGENVEELPGAPMCGCVEQMPVVTKAGCTETTADQTVTVSYDPVSKFVTSVDITSITHRDCGDLATHYDDLVTQGKASAREKALLAEHLVGEGQCGAAIADFLDAKGFALV